MADPNVQAAKGDATHLSEYVAALNMGMLPVALRASHPTIVFRWHMEHITAPMQTGQAQGRRRPHASIIPPWREGIWVDAWIWGLFHLRGAMEAFSNAWTTVQENKPKILELKILYDAALADPEKRLLLLTEMRLGLPRAETPPEILTAVNASMHRVQSELDKLGR